MFVLTVWAFIVATSYLKSNVFHYESFLKWPAMSLYKLAQEVSIQGSWCKQMSLTGTWPPYAWFSVASFSRFPHVGRLIELGKWFSSNLPQHIRQLRLQQPVEQKPTNDAGGARMKMIVGTGFAPRSYLLRFRELRQLSVDLFDGESVTRELILAGQDGPRMSMYYIAVPAALGRLLETGSFPKLRTLEINMGGYHSGEFKNEEEEPNMEDATKPFWYYTWVHQLALKIICAVDSGATPLLCNVSINDNFDTAYYDDFGFKEERMRQAGDPQTTQLRNELARCTTKARRRAQQQ